MDITIGNILILIIASAIAGAVGQLIRAIIGIIQDKTTYDRLKNDALIKLLTDRLQTIQPKDPEAETINNLITDHNALFSDKWKADKGRLLFTILLSLAIGSLAGIFFMLSGMLNSTTPVTQLSVLSSIVAGYSGTDFIEGFMNKNNLSLTNN
jgi:hypothetical protein